MQVRRQVANVQLSHGTNIVPQWAWEPATVCRSKAPLRCYNVAMLEQVGVRELRDQLSRYLERAKAGEQIEITERGRPIALLVPLPESRAAVTELVASGQVKLAEQPWWPGTARAAAPEGGPLPSEVLDEQRADRL